MGKIIADILAAIGNFLNDFIGATLGKLIFVPMIKSMLGDGPGDPGFVNSLYNSMMIKANGFYRCHQMNGQVDLGGNLLILFKRRLFLLVQLLC